MLTFDEFKGFSEFLAAAEELAVELKEELVKKPVPDLPEVPNGTFTFENTETGKRRTVRLRTSQDENFFYGKRLIDLMVGPDNNHSYLSVGRVLPDGKVKVWNKHKGTQFEKIAAWAVQVLRTEPPENVRVLAAKRCICCNRKLTVPSSIHQNMGPRCAEKAGF